MKGGVVLRIGFIFGRSNSEWKRGMGWMDELARCWDNGTTLPNRRVGGKATVNFGLGSSGNLLHICSFLD